MSDVDQHKAFYNDLDFAACVESLHKRVHLQPFVKRCSQDSTAAQVEGWTQQIELSHKVDPASEHLGGAARRYGNGRAHVSVTHCWFKVLFKHSEQSICQHNIVLVTPLLHRSLCGIIDLW